MENSIYTMPVVAKNVLYVASKNELFAISKGAVGKDPGILIRSNLREKRFE